MIGYGERRLRSIADEERPGQAPASKGAGIPPALSFTVSFHVPVTDFPSKAESGSSGWNVPVNGAAPAEIGVAAASLKTVFVILSRTTTPAVEQPDGRSIRRGQIDGQIADKGVGDRSDRHLHVGDGPATRCCAPMSRRWANCRGWLWEHRSTRRWQGYLACLSGPRTELRTVRHWRCRSSSTGRAFRRSGRRHLRGEERGVGNDRVRSNDAVVTGRLSDRCVRCYSFSTPLNVGNGLVADVLDASREP